MVSKAETAVLSFCHSIVRLTYAALLAGANNGRPTDDDAFLSGSSPQSDVQQSESGSPLQIPRPANARRSTGSQSMPASHSEREQLLLNAVAEVEVRYL